MLNANKINSVLITAWYPHEKKYHFGAFVKEHAEAISLFSNVYVVYLRFFKRGIIPKILIKEESLNGVTVYYVNISSPIRKYGLHDYLVKMAYKKALSKINLKSKIDIIHINVRNKYTKLVSSISLIKNTPIIVTEHSSFYHTGINKLSILEQKKETNEIKSWFTNPNIKYVLPVSKQLGGVLSTNFGIDKNKIKVVPNVANRNFHYSEKRNNGIIKIALVANWEAPKNPILLLNALLKLKTELQSKISIDWIGGGSQIEDVKSFIKNNLLEYSIKFWGLQEKKFIGEVLRKADFLIHPTDAENLPTVIIESLCCGTPVLTHRVNGIPELINDSNGIMCEAKSVGDFSLQLKKMIKTCKDYDHEAISIQASKLFSQQSISNQFQIIYNNTLKI